MTQATKNTIRYLLLAMVGFLIGSAVRTADAAQARFESNYAIAYETAVAVCTGEPGNDCDRPGE